MPIGLIVKDGDDKEEQLITAMKKHSCKRNPFKVWNDPHHEEKAYKTLHVEHQMMISEIEHLK